MHDPTSTVAGGDAIDRRIEWIVATLERMRRAEPPAKGADALRPSLVYAAQLLDLWASVAPALQQGADSHRWDEREALAARVALEIYERAVHEVRLVALDARASIEHADAVLAEAHEFARRRRRRAGKMARLLGAASEPT